MAPETCSECDECCFSWFYSKWFCGRDPNDTKMLDNDIYTSIHDDCPLHKEGDI